MLSSCRLALFAASLTLGPLFVATNANANGALIGQYADEGPTSLGMRVAIASGAQGTTRWSDVTVPAGQSTVGWLVPVRANAVVDWAPGPWLDALDDATSPRILPASGKRECASRTKLEVSPRWTTTGVAQESAPFATLATAASAKEWASEHGLRMSPSQAVRVDELYTSGWHVVAIAIAPSFSTRTSATVRVTDDGGSVLPLALTGNSTARNEIPITVFVVGAGAAELKSDGVVTKDVDASKILWGESGSTYATHRESTITYDGKVWLRESSSHRALVEDEPGMTSIVTRYFDDRDCRAEVRMHASKSEVVAPADLTCGIRTDLARALAGIAPRSAIVTRLAGSQPGQRFAENLNVEITSATERPVAIRASGFLRCSSTGRPPTYDPPTFDPDSGAPSRPGQAPSRPSGGSQSGGSSSSTTTETYYTPSDGCGGGGGTVVYDDYGDDDDYYDDDISMSDDSGWDSSDSDDSCSGDTSSSDGWDSSDSGDCSTAKKAKRRAPSRFSRLALFGVALLLPLRRRLRPTPGAKS